MNKITKRYISEIKALFPIMGKAERDYIHALSDRINNDTSEKNIDTIQKLYDIYGKPSDTVNTYFSYSDTSEIIKKIQLCKWIKRGIIFLLVLATLAFGTWGIITYNVYQTFKEEQAVFIDTTIEN